MNILSEKSKTLRNIALVLGGCFFASCIAYFISKGMDEKTLPVHPDLKNTLLLLAISFIGYIIGFSHGREGGIVIFAGGLLLLMSLLYYGEQKPYLAPIAALPLMIAGFLLWLSEAGGKPVNDS